MRSKMDNSVKPKYETPLPIEKYCRWLAALQHGIGSLKDSAQLTVMNPAGRACASDLMVLCERYLGKKISDHRDLILGWNRLRKSRGLKGSWKIRDGCIEGVFGQCVDQKGMPVNDLIVIYDPAVFIDDPVITVFLFVVKMIE